MISIVISLALLINQTKAYSTDLPQGQRLNLGTADKPDYRQCYTFDGYKAILELKIDADAAVEINGVLTQKVNLQQEMIDKQDQMLKLKDTDIGVLSAEKTRLYNMWSKENEVRLQLENKPSLGSWMGWSAAAILAVTTVFLTGWIIAR